MIRTGRLAAAAAAAKRLQLCPTLCDPIDGSPPGSSVPGILQARILEWVAPPRDLPNPGIKPLFSTLAGELFTISAPWEALMMTIPTIKRSWDHQ